MKGNSEATTAADFLISYLKEKKNKLPCPPINALSLIMCITWHDPHFTDEDVEVYVGKPANQRSHS